jgi:hypothetical protein
MGESASSDEVTDRVLQDEIELLGDVMAATVGRDRHLSEAEVDQALRFCVSWRNDSSNT